MSTVVMLVFVPILVSILLILTPLISFSPLNQIKGYADKVSSYECGFTPITGQNRGQITVAFYIVSILYLVFDLEIAILIPIVPSLQVLGAQGFIAAILFILILTVGFVYEIGSGAINWSKIKS